MQTLKHGVCTYRAALVEAALGWLEARAVYRLEGEQSSQNIAYDGA